MEAQVSRSSRFRIALWLLYLSAICCGCRSSNWPVAFEDRIRGDSESKANDEAEGRESRDAESTTSDRRRGAETGNRSPSSGSAANESEKPDIPAAIRDLDWVRAVALPGDEPPLHHWRHLGLDAMLLREGRARPDLSKMLNDPNPIAAGNAAIAMARWQVGHPEERLKKTVRLGESDLLALDPQSRQSLRAGAKERSLQVIAFRCAAAESLGDLPKRLAVKPLRDLIDEHGQFDAEAKAIYQPDVHAELLSALSRHVAASDDPRFRRALLSPTPVVQIEALRIWARDSSGELPREAAELRLSDSPSVRAAALRTLAERRSPGAHEYLKRGLNDADAEVRLAAVAALGALGTQEARDSLRAMKDHRSEFLRAAAVGALAALGGDESLIDAAVDKSWKVRQAVADTLAALPSDAASFKREARALANDLVRDANSQVQQHAIAAITDWPTEQAGPVLLVGMASGNFQVRRQAAKALAERWPAAASFPVDGGERQRSDSLAKLSRQFAADFGPYDEILETVADVQQLAQLSAEQWSELRRHLATLKDPRASEELRRRAADALARYGPPLIAALEVIAVEQAGPLPGYLYSEVLPRVSPYFVAINKLSSDNVAERRSGAAELAKLVGEAKKTPMPNLALSHLSQLLASEPDPLVWQAVMTAIAHDPRGAAAQLAYLAVASASVEVRRRAADYLAEHADRGHVAVLLPLLDDPSPIVVIAAIRALGRQGDVDDLTPLLLLLNKSDVNLRLEAAISLARLRARDGIATLESLARESSVEIRRRVAAAMGELSEPSFIATLITMLDDRSDIQAEALRSLPKCCGEDICAGEPGDAKLLPDEQVRRWKQWHRNRQSSERGLTDRRHD